MLGKIAFMRELSCNAAQFLRILARWLGLVGSLSALAGCGAIYDSMFPPPPDERQQIVFYIGQQAYEPSLVLRTGRGGYPRLYTEQKAIVTGADIEMAVPMKDAAGYFFVGIRLTDSGARKLAQASKRAIGKELALVADELLIGSALIDSPLDKGTFAMATRDQNSAFRLAGALSPRIP